VDTKTLTIAALDDFLNRSFEGQVSLRKQSKTRQNIMWQIQWLVLCKRLLGTLRNIYYL